MDRPLVRPRRAEFLLRESLHQRDLRAPREFARQRELVLPVRVPIGALELIRGLPKRARVLARPLRHVGVAASRDLAIALFREWTVAVDVLRMLKRRALRAGVDL